MHSYPIMEILDLFTIKESMSFWKPRVSGSCQAKTISNLCLLSVCYKTVNGLLTNYSGCPSNIIFFICQARESSLVPVGFLTALFLQKL